jgi:hypothetical protein
MIVISYFCGGGGNRYQYYVQNHVLYKENGYYHKIPHPMELFDITIDTPVITNNESIQHTHCLNTKLLKHVFPNYKIIKIKTEWEPATYRGWSLLKNNKQMTRIERTDSAFSWICNTTAYYKTYPADWEADTLIEIDKKDCEFSKVFHKELYSYKICKEWQLAKQAHDKFGDSAPIIDLAKETFNE